MQFINLRAKTNQSQMPKLFVKVLKNNLEKNLKGF